MLFDIPEANACTGQCNGCLKKLLDYLDAELEDWEYQMDAGESPDFGKINRIARISKKIYQVMQKYDLIDE